MQRPGSGLFRTFNEVGLAVAKATQGQQIPWVSSSPISGNFYFAGKPAMAAAGPAPVAPHAPVPARLVQEARLSPADDPLRHDLITDCDRLAAMPYDTGHPPSLPGVEPDKISITAAAVACNDAMARYPDVTRFVFEAGRVATARRDFAEARRLYEQAAAAGYAMAMNNLGGVYEGGDGASQNYAEAARWYGKAVAAGEPIAMVDLGWLYETGHGVTRDYAEAVRLYEAAAKAGVPAGMNNLGLLYMYGYVWQRRRPRLCRGEAPVRTGRRPWRGLCHERARRNLQRRRRRSPQCHRGAPMVREGGGTGQSGGKAESKGDAPVVTAHQARSPAIELGEASGQV
jgi:Sel1 repeat